MELQVIAATVIGGANLAGGIGTAFGALVGSALIEVIRNSLGLLGISAFWQGAFVGSSLLSLWRLTGPELSARVTAAILNPHRRLADFQIAIIFCSSGGGFEAMRVCRRTVQSGKTM